MTELQWIETGITLMTYILARFIIHRSIDTMVANQQATKTRSKVVKKAINFTLLLVVTAISSVFTILGIALFAQWSILSNITAGVIIFFNHTVSLDDTISIIDKDYEVEGRISDIGLMFVVLKTKENEQISIPNNVFIQKMVKNKK